MLLLHVEASFAQPIRERILVNFFQMPVGVVNMDGIRRLPNDVAQFVDGFGLHV
ncbi:hypothetical protein D3C83_138870 [compost metagenome]